MRDLTAFFKVQGRFVLLAVLCCATTVAAVVLLVLAVITPDTGLVGYYPEVVVRGGKVHFAPSEPFSPAIEAGLRPGEDQVISVNGSAVASSRDVVRAVSAIRGFAGFPVEVLREGAGRLTVEVVPAFLPTRIDWTFTLVFCLALAAMAFAVSWRLPHEPWSVPLVLSALLSLLFTCLKPFAYAHPLSNALFNLGNVSSWLLVIFALLFPWERGRRTARIVSIVSILSFFAVFFALRVILSIRWLSSGEESLLDAYKLVGQIGNVGDGLAYVILGCLLGSALARTRFPRDRAILQWLLAGMLVALPAYFFLDQLPLVLGGDAARIGLGGLAQLFLSVLPLSLLAGLTARRSFSFRAFAARYAVYGMLFILMIALFTVVYLPLKGAIQSGYAVGSPLPELLSVSVIFLLLVIIRFPLEKVSVAFLTRVTGGTQLAPLNAVVSTGAGPGSASTAERRLSEMRAMLKGMARTLRDPAHRLPEQGAPAALQQAAGVGLVELVRALESHSAAGPFIRAMTTPQALARAAAGHAGSGFEAVRIRIQDDAGGHVICCFQEVVRALASALQNAVESQAGGGAPILVRISHNEDDAVIEVIDQGCGLGTVARKKLFTPFVSSKPGHVGLGLCVARAIMERNEGRLELEPGENGGTIARFSLPCVRGAGPGKETF